MRRAASAVRLALLGLAAALAGGAVLAQGNDAPRPPRILPGAPSAAPTATTPPGNAESTPAQIPLGALRPPSATRLAPLPEERAGAIDEIVVIGRGWRLPDLGSEWRARQQQEAREGRLNATLLPLYDPERPPLHAERTFASREEQRHGFIELFRLRFGRRGRAAADD